MNQLGSLFTDDMRAKQFFICRRKDKLDHPAVVTNDLPARVLFIEGAPNQIRDILFLAFIFCEANRRNLGDRIDRQR